MRCGCKIVSYKRIAPARQATISCGLCSRGTGHNGQTFLHSSHKFLQILTSMSLKLEGIFGKIEAKEQKARWRPRSLASLFVGILFSNILLFTLSRLHCQPIDSHRRILLSCVCTIFIFTLSGLLSQSASKHRHPKDLAVP